tara:strand:- start:102 stop:428 length:327 start_codon:yes stop_codon:yes gene_type:complete
MSESNTSSLSFEQDFTEAISEYSSSGRVCQFFGILSLVIAFFSTIYAISGMLSSAWAWASVISLIISGVSLIVFGAIATEQRKQTALLALQTWELQRRANPEIGQYRI